MAPPRGDKSKDEVGCCARGAKHQQPKREKRRGGERQGQAGQEGARLRLVAQGPLFGNPDGGRNLGAWWWVLHWGRAVFEAYSVGIRLSLVNGVSAGLTAIARQFHTLDRDTSRAASRIGEFERSLMRVTRLAAGGSMLAAAGGGILGLFKAPLDAAREYETAFARFKTLNLGDHINSEADKFARATNAFGTSHAAMMDTFRESFAFFGSLDQARFASTKIAELNAANAVLFGGNARSIDAGATRSLMRFADMRGATNSPEDFFKTLNLAQRMVTGSGGSLGFGDLESLAKTGGTAFKSLSDEGIVHLASAMQEMGGSRTGTALMTLYQNLVAGRTTHQAKFALQDLGLADLERFPIGTVGGKTQTRLRTVVNPEFLSALRVDPVMALDKFLMPAINSRLGPGATDEQRAKAINDVFSDRTGSNLATGVALQMVQVMRDSKFITRAMGVAETTDAARKTTDGQMLELQSRWRDVLKELGLAVLPAAIKAAQGLAAAIATVTNFARENPGIVKMGAALAGVAATGALFVGGMLAVRGAILGAQLAIGTTGVAGGLVAGLSGLATGLAVVGVALTSLYQVVRLYDAAAGWVGASTRDGVTLSLQARRQLAIGGDPGAVVDWKRPAAVPPAGGATTQVHTQINMDGRRVGEAVSRHQAASARRPAAGASWADPSSTMPDVFIATQ